MNRWWIYQRERFPLAGHGPLIAAFSFSAVSFSYLLRGGEGFPAPAALVVAFVSSIIFFLQLRIADEFKDVEEDSRHRPYRPVPRGLVTLRELGTVGLISALLQMVLALWWAPPRMVGSSLPFNSTTSMVSAHFSPGLAALLMAVWVYLALMSREFFVRDWIKARPVTYLWTHMLILPLIDFYATACDWMGAGRRPPDGLFWFLIVSFCNGLVVEIGRKIRAPADEESGVQTYTVLWGRRNAVLAWLAAILLTAFCAGQAAAKIHFVVPVTSLLSILLIAAGILAFCFLKEPATRHAKRLELMSGLWTLCLYLSLGTAPLVMRALK